MVGKAVVVFGATGSVGASLVKHLAEMGMPGVKDLKIVAVADHEDKIGAMKIKYKNIECMCKNAMKFEEVKDVIESVKKDGIIGVANCIGDYHRQHMEEEGDEVMMEHIRCNVVPGWNILRAAAPAMAAQQGGGSIVCVGASVVHYGIQHHEGWAAAKGALEAMYRNAAATYAPNNVRINCVASGLIFSHEGASADYTANPEWKKKTEQIYPLRRLTQPQEVAHAMCFLMHPNTSFTTGASFPVNGGLGFVSPQAIPAPTAQAPAGRV